MPGTPRMENRLSIMLSSIQEEQSHDSPEYIKNVCSILWEVDISFSDMNLILQWLKDINRDRPYFEPWDTKASLRGILSWSAEALEILSAVEDDPLMADIARQAKEAIEDMNSLGNHYFRVMALRLGAWIWIIEAILKDKGFIPIDGRGTRPRPGRPHLR